MSRWSWPVGRKSSAPGRRVLERFENMRVIRIDEERAIPDNVDVSERVLDLLDLSVDIYGVESE